MNLLSDLITAALIVAVTVLGLIEYNRDKPPTYEPELTASVQVKLGAMAGSGVFITPDKVLTAKHVARGGLLLGEGATLTVEDINGVEHTVTHVEVAEDADAAILTVAEPLTGAKPMSLTCRLPDRGEELHNVGNPWGDIRWFLQRLWVADYETRGATAERAEHGEFNGLVLYQGLAIGGQSGSPIFDADRNVVGILVAGIGAPGRDAGSADVVGAFVATNYICEWLAKQLNQEVS